MTTTDTPYRNVSALRYLHDTQTSIEKLRISIGNRVSAIERGVDSAPAIYERLRDTLEVMESDVEREAERELKNWPVYNSWLKHVKGIGPSLATQLLSLLLPPLENKGVGTWYKAAGLYAEDRPDGTRRMPRPRAGEGRITYYPRLRRDLYNVATSFVRNGGYYREVYDSSKARIFAQHCWDADAFLQAWKSTGVQARYDFIKAKYPDATITPTEAITPSYSKAVEICGISDETWPLGRVESAARWSTVSLFLGHLYEMWARAESINIRPPYIVEYTQHHYIAPPEFDGHTKI